MADAIWDHTNEQHRRVFLALLAPMIAATRPREFADFERAKDQAIAWILSLRDVPQEVLEAGRDRLMARGLRWMPRPGELREACADVVDARRSVIASEVVALKARCPRRADGECVNDFVEEAGAVRRCDCHRVGPAMMQQITAPIARPALPPAEGEVA